MFMRFYRFFIAKYCKISKSWDEPFFDVLLKPHHVKFWGLSTCTVFTYYTQSVNNQEPHLVADIFTTENIGLF